MVDAFDLPGVERGRLSPEAAKRAIIAAAHEPVIGEAEDLEQALHHAVTHHAMLRRLVCELSRVVLFATCQACGETFADLEELLLHYKPGSDTACQEDGAWEYIEAVRQEPPDYRVGLEVALELLR